MNEACFSRIHLKEISAKNYKLSKKNDYYFSSFFVFVLLFCLKKTNRRQKNEKGNECLSMNLNLFVWEIGIEESFLCCCFGLLLHSFVELITVSVVVRFE